MGLVGAVISAIRGDQTASAAEQALLLPAVVELINGYPGGLQGLVQKFHRDGLGEIVASWIGNGPNQPVSPAQLRKVLGDSGVDQLAKTSGQSSEALLGNLGKLMPILVDHVSPEGRLEKNQQLNMESLMGSVSGVLRKL